MKTSGVGRVAEDDKTEKEAGAMAPVVAGNDGQSRQQHRQNDNIHIKL